MNGTTSEITVGKYLLDRLVQLGVTRVFGVPGDFNLNFLDLIDDHPQLEWVGLANEMNAAYACSGYARVTNGISALVTTFGVGDLSATNGIANAYAERVGIVHIVGSPATNVQTGKAIVHHTLGDGRFDTFREIAKTVTVDQTRLETSRTAELGGRIDSVLRKCVISRRPVYIDLAMDAVFEKISSEPLKHEISLPSIRRQLADPGVNTKLLEHVTNRCVELLQKASRPIIIVDSCAVRHDMLDLTRQLIDATGLPFLTTPMAKAAIDESHPLFTGVYAGKVSDDEVYALAQSADLGLSIGRLRSDMNTGGWSYVLDPEIEIELHSSEVMVQYARYFELNAFMFIPSLIKAIKALPKKIQSDIKPLEHAALKVTKGKALDPQAKLTHKAMWPILGSTLKPNDVVVAEVGSAHFGLLDIKLPPVTFDTATLWASIGWGGGAIVGAAIAAKEQRRRVFLFTGEGSYQETIQDLGTLMREGCTPTIFVINNSGYTIERLIWGKSRKYNDVTPWNWQLALKFMGGTDNNSTSYRVENEGELQHLLSDPAFLRSDKTQLVELVLDKFDCPPQLQKHLETALKRPVLSN